jgi:serine/threonine protein kinase
MTEYKLHANKQIGTGAFGSVQAVNIEKVNKLISIEEELDSSMTYALKILSPKYKVKQPQTQQEEERYMLNSSYHSNLIRELCTMPKLVEENMVQLYTPHVSCIWFSNTFDAEGIPEQKGQQKAFILQRKFSMDCGYLFRHASLTVADKSNFYRCLIHHLASIHEKGIAHRDLKPANILYHQFLNLFAVTDFGQTSLLEGISRQKVNVCTRDVRAPEYLLDSTNEQVSFPHGVEGDIWSFGMVILCAELKKSSQPLTSMAHIKDEDNYLLREIVRERFQGLFSTNDLSFGPDSLPFQKKARFVLARTLTSCKTLADIEAAEKKIPIQCNLENLYLLQNSLRINPGKRATASTLSSVLRLPIARKKPMSSKLYQQIPAVPETAVQEIINIPTQTLLDGTKYSQFPIPKYKVTIKTDAKRKFMLQQLVLILRCVITNSTYKCNMTEFLIQSIDIFDRLFSSVSAKRMKDLFYTSARKVSIPTVQENTGIELNSQTTLYSIFSPSNLEREDFENYDFLVLAIYIADQTLHYGPLTTIETLIKKLYTSSWKGFSKNFLVLKTGKEHEEQYFYDVYWTFVKTKEKFLAYFFQESLASLNFSVVEDSLLFLLRKNKVARSAYIVSKILEILESKPSFKINEEDIDAIQLEFNENMCKDVSISLNWGWIGHTNKDYEKPFVVEF